MNLKIRPFLTKDLARVLEIEKASFKEPWPRSYFKSIYLQHPEDFFVAEVKKNIVGYIIGEFNSTAEIITLAVGPDWRQKSIGRKLSNFLIDRFKKKGVKEIFLNVRIGNRVAISFYKNLDFKILEKVKNYYRNGEDAYRMKKEI